MVRLDRRESFGVVAINDCLTRTNGETIDWLPIYWFRRLLMMNVRKNVPDSSLVEFCLKEFDSTTARFARTP